MKKEERTKELMETIILDDVKEFEIKEIAHKPKLGFRVGEKIISFNSLKNPPDCGWLLGRIDNLL